MSNIAKLYPQEVKSNYFGSAQVIETDALEGRVRVRVELQQGVVVEWARVAVSSIDPLQQGDEVLVAGEESNDLYVIGVLTLMKPVNEKPVKHEIGNGSYTIFDKSAVSPVLQIFSKRNELIFEYDPRLEKTRVNVESGNLEFATCNGDIIFNAGQNIQINGQRVDIAANSTIKLAVVDAIGQFKTSFSLQSYRAKLSSTEFSILSKVGDFRLGEIRYVGDKFLGKVKNSQLFVEKLSTVAKSITEKSQNVYRTVEQLSQLKANRVRTLISSTFHFKAKNSYMKSEQGFKINADKIHLG